MSSSATIADNRDRDSLHAPPGYKSATGRQMPPHFDVDSMAPPGVGPPNLKRRLSIRSGGATGRALRSRPSPSVGSAGGGGGCTSQIQLLSIPQLDAIQRTLRILDVRLQHVQSNAKDDDRARQDIDHIRRLMSENQNALSTVVTVLSSIQEEARRLSITVHKNQMTTIQLQPPTSNHPPTRVAPPRTDQIHLVRGTD